jgi:hypothetical protein
MRPPRFHLRTLLIAVAAVGMVLGCGIEAVRMSRWAGACRATAAAYARSALFQQQAVHMARVALALAQRRDCAWRRRAAEARSEGEVIELGDRDVRRGRERLASAERRLAWSARLARKYERAARCPWLPVAPDPPPPE